MIARLRSLRFSPCLDDGGALLITDALGMRRDASRHLPIVKVFDDIVAGLNQDPRLLDSEDCIDDSPL